MGVPKAERDRQGIDTDRRPPGGLIAVAMEFAVMKPTDRDRELVADFFERSRLSKANVVRFGGRPAEAYLAG
jgi:hypothetical protein